MAQAKASAVASAAVSLLNGPEIPYIKGGSSVNGADCQGFVEMCVSKAGGAISYAGSNEMWRKACVRRETLTEAKRSGMMVPGALLFIHAHDGKEPAKYHGDGEGNASHVGVYVGVSDAVYSVDASASAGRVRARSRRDAEHMWSHAAWFREVEYNVYDQGLLSDVLGGVQEGGTASMVKHVQEPQQGFPPASQVQEPVYSAGGYPYPACVSVPGGGRLTVRTAPRVDAKTFNGHIEPGSAVEVLDDYSTPGWAQIRYRGRAYWCQAQYLMRMPTQAVGQVQALAAQQYPPPAYDPPAQQQPGYPTAPQAPVASPNDGESALKDEILGVLFKGLLGEKY